MYLQYFIAIAFANQLLTTSAAPTVQSPYHSMHDMDRREVPNIGRDLVYHTTIAKRPVDNAINTAQHKREIPDIDVEISDPTTIM
jgi:hypothetical protein